MKYSVKDPTLFYTELLRETVCAGTLRMLSNETPTRESESDFFFNRKYVYSEIPDQCNSFEGPLSRACLAALWVGSGCLKPGEGYPLNATNIQIYDMDDIKYVLKNQLLICW